MWLFPVDNFISAVISQTTVTNIQEATKEIIYKYTVYSIITLCLSTHIKM